MSAGRKLGRGFLAGGLAAGSTALLGGCDAVSDQPWLKRVLDSAETLTRVTQEALLSPQALAREFSEADISREFRANGSTDPDDPAYARYALAQQCRSAGTANRHRHRHLRTLRL
jgi:citrate lyase beta subunit